MIHAWLLLASLQLASRPALAGKTEATLPPALVPLAGSFSPAAPASEALSPLYDGGRLRVGKSLIDPEAPGAHALIASLKNDPPIVLGTFDRRSQTVLNAFPYGYDGIDEHKKAMPPGFTRNQLGGYVFGMEPDGSYEFAGSGHLPSPLTGAVKRGILRYLGVAPAQETFRQRLWRLFLELVDWAR